MTFPLWVVETDIIFVIDVSQATSQSAFNSVGIFYFDNVQVKAWLIYYAQQFFIATRVGSRFALVFYDTIGAYTLHLGQSDSLGDLERFLNNVTYTASSAPVWNLVGAINFVANNVLSRSTQQAAIVFIATSS